MTGEARPPETRIGATLARARAQAGLELPQIEEQTKVRAKYLRALEEERWEELPSTAYAKAFLRTYANALGLDAEFLVDELRRQVGADAVAPSEIRARFPTAAVIVVATVLALVIAGLALLGDGEEEGEPTNPGPRPGNGERRAGGPDVAAGELVRLELRARTAVEVCLLGAGGEELIDGQLLTAGSRDAFASERFQLRFPAGFDPGQVELELNGERARLPRIQGPARLRITPPRRVRQASAPGKSCP